MRLLIIDDHPMTCAGLKSLLQGHYPQAHIDTLHACTDDVPAQDWDYLFLDMHLPGQPFHLLLQTLQPRLNQVILISAYPEADAVEQARAQGVRGLLPKHIDIERILDGFQRIRQGEYLFIDHHGAVLPALNRRSNLTGRQQEILDALLAGLSNKQIARRHDISEYTVKEHVTAILAVYGARNRLELLLQHRPPVG